MKSGVGRGSVVRSLMHIELRWRLEVEEALKIYSDSPISTESGRNLAYD